MEAKILAICDQEKYALKLMKAFCEKKSFGFQVRVFSDAKELEKALLQMQIEILLISGKYMSEKISCFNIGKIILLSDGEVFEEFSDYESIYKYQTAEHILKEILCYYAEYARPAATLRTPEREIEVHGIYSPVGRCGKSVLAKALAEKFGKRQKTLLINLQSFSAVPEQFENEGLWDLADLIYFLRQGKNTFLYKLGSIVQSQGTYDYILPMKTPADLRSVTLAEWTELLEKLASESTYHVVVLDFGPDICGLFGLLSQCTRVYTPMLVDEESKRKVENFWKILMDENFEKLIGRIQKICLPEELNYEGVKTFVKGWVERSVK